MALIGFHHEDQAISNTREISRKSESVTEWWTCEKCGVMNTDIECLSCGEVKALKYFQLLNMRYDNRNVDTERVSTIVL